jgi:hypothetical protein
MPRYRSSDRPPPRGWNRADQLAKLEAAVHASPHEEFTQLRIVALRIPGIYTLNDASILMTEYEDKHHGTVHKVRAIVPSRTSAT